LLEHQLTAGDLLRMAGGVAYWRGLYSAIEGLAGRPKVRGNFVFGRVLWLDMYRIRLQLVPPFDNRCTCPIGRNCRHVVTLGLTFLHQERRRAGSSGFPRDEFCYYLVSRLEHDDLRGLAMQLLAAVPQAIDVARQYLDRPGHYTDADEYALDEAGDEDD
jgi:uncharacterized Zn finger protein